MNDEEVQPGQYEEIGRMVVPEVASLVEDHGFIPPLEIYLIDACCRPVFSVQMNALGNFQNLQDTNAPQQALFPINVTVTDKNGKTWSTSIAASDLPALQ